MAAPTTHHDLVTATNPSQSVDSNIQRTRNLHEFVADTPAFMNSDDVDANSDDEDDSGENDDDEVAPDFSADADSIIGVSIGPIQTDLKSPTTPAATKAQVLNASSSYFAAEVDGQNEIFEEPLEKEPSLERTTPTQISPKSNSEPTPKSAVQPSSPPKIQIIKGQEKPEKRSSLVSSILGSANTGTRSRSSSGSSMVENIRKRLPGLPSISLPKFSVSGDGERSTTESDGMGKAVPPQGIYGLTRPNHGRTRSQQYQNESSKAPLNSAAPNIKSRNSGQIETDSTTSRQPLLRRSTSDHSLYLRRAATGSSDFDDYTAFANVSEMVNSRFKAITDSFQDSALRRPRILSVGRDSGRNTPARTNSDETRSNTMMNAASDLPSDKPKASNSSPLTDTHASKHPILKTSLSRMTGDLVIMGGYRGSILREAQPPHRQLWVPIKVGINLRRADLEVGLTREDELNMEEKIIPDGTLSHIGPVDICRRLIRKCRHCPNVQNGRLNLHDYGYDWRLSPDLLSDRLIQFLESLPCNSPELPAEKRGAWMISHSLGGLITRHVVNRRPDLVAGVVYAGTPQNCVNILGPLRKGDDVLFSSRVLTAQVNFTLRTSYALLPQNGRCFINKQTGERYDVDFFDAKTWDEYRLSPCIKAPLHRHKPEKKTSFIGSLSEAITQPTKHLSWFSFTTDESAGIATSASEQAKDQADKAIENVAEAADAAKPARPFSPDMTDGSSHQHKPSIATQCTIPPSQATEYLSRTLASVLQFKENLSHRPTLQAQNAYPPASVLFAKNTPTVYGAFVTSREAIKYDDAFDDLAFAAGDGVVLASAAQLPCGYRCVRNGRIESDRGHVGLLGDMEGVGKCLAAILDARHRGVGVGAYDQDISQH